MPNIRLTFRHETLLEELDMIAGKIALHTAPATGRSEADKHRRNLVLPSVDNLAAGAMAGPRS